ncbi:MAG TPA: anti-sigma factor antagonist [Gammaproteobacteria bacterium]|nr:anti-sigma factor antagonist [Gammaproteobacteria bacterium]
MEIKKRNESGYSIISLVGEVDLHFSPKAREEILKALKNNENVLVELSEVSYIDSSGIASLVEGYQMSKKSGQTFGLLSVSNAAMQVLKLARLDSVFPIYDNVEDVKD